MNQVDTVKCNHFAKTYHTVGVKMIPDSVRKQRLPRRPLRTTAVLPHLRFRSPRFQLPDIDFGLKILNGNFQKGAICTFRMAHPPECRDELWHRPGSPPGTQHPASLCCARALQVVPRNPSCSASGLLWYHSAWVHGALILFSNGPKAQE